VAGSAGILPEGGRILVAVSGGVDSMVLLRVLHDLKPVRKWMLVAAHFNHQLRGRSSDADARFVASQCEQLGVPCVVGQRDVKSLAKRRKVSIEMAAREARHRFLSQVARRRRCPVIAVAHHADDQAELVLLRLLRGSGSEGLGGMNPMGPSPMTPDIQVVRPLLEVSRTRIEDFARNTRIKFREDRSNEDVRILRNRVRHELLPLLRNDYQPAIDRVLVRTASILSGEAECIGNLAGSWLRERSTPFDLLPLAVKRRVIQLQALELGAALDFEACERLIRHPGMAVNIPGGEILRRDSDGNLSRVKGCDLSHSEKSCRVTLSKADGVQFGGRGFGWRLEERLKRRPIRPVPNEECFDAARVGRTILLRHWRAGDRFQPIGMRTPVKLQDLFTNLKVPQSDRRRRVVAESESGEVFWVEGLRIGDGFKLAPKTRKCLVWRWTCW